VCASKRRSGNGKAIFVVHSDGSGLRRLTPWELRAEMDPTGLPTASASCFAATRASTSPTPIFFTVGVDGTGLEQVTDVEPTTRLYSSGFSPDGTSITFGMQGTDGAADVFTMRLDGTGLTPVTRTPLGDSAPDWGATPE
jgi:TolB protein